MTEKKERPKAGATELNEDELEEVQGGLLAHELTNLKDEKADGFKAGADLSKK